ncbi:MAG: alpha/beta hydrolase [Anaerolineae bacterium]
MTASSIEHRTRAILPIIRLMQTVIPLPLARWLTQQSMTRVQLGAGVNRQAVSADGVPCEWIIPQNNPTDQVLLYLHGGGFIFGLTPLHLKMGAYLARDTSMRVLMVDYHLAPDYPFPAALEDCVTAYRWLLRQGIVARDIAVAGDSAGGNLTITMLMRLRDSGSALPAAAACLSPVTDLTPDHKRREGFRDPLLPDKAVKLYAESYLGHHDAHDPLVSPVFGDLRGLPPLLVHAGEDESLRDDAIRITNLAQSVGVDVRLEIYPRMWHVWQLYLALPQAVQSLDDIAQFLESHVGVNSTQPKRCQP